MNLKYLWSQALVESNLGFVLDEVQKERNIDNRNQSLFLRINVHSTFG